MSGVVPYIVVFGCLAAVLALLNRLKRVLLARGVAGSAVRGALASYEQAMRVTSYESHVEIRAQADRIAPIVSDDPRWTPRPATGAGARRTQRPRRRLRRRLRS